MGRAFCCPLPALTLSASTASPVTETHVCLAEDGGDISLLVDWTVAYSWRWRLVRHDLWVEIPLCRGFTGWYHMHTVLWCVSSMWVWTFFMHRKQRKESEFKKTMAIFKNGSGFKQKSASLFRISTYLGKIAWLPQLGQEPLQCFLCRASWWSWWNEPLLAHRLMHHRKPEKMLCSYRAPHQGSSAQTVSLLQQCHLILPGGFYFAYKTSTGSCFLPRLSAPVMGAEPYLASSGAKGHDKVGTETGGDEGWGNDPWVLAWGQSLSMSLLWCIDMSDQHSIPIGDWETLRE